MGGIPGWSTSGVLPPINVSSPTSPDRSPYRIDLTDLTLRFSTSTERQAILTGFLDYRGALHETGLTKGFQWLNGSFLEDIEATANRPPNDIDVVTFFRLPDGQSQRGLMASSPALFDHDDVKQAYSVDAYLVELTAESPDRLVKLATYWYSVWSHRRTGEWKGFLEVDLDPTNDSIAMSHLMNPSHGDRP